ncbi:uncharacterized protein LOC112191296 [Rosa chinensis]|uniref:uncharacterized protein LOC112191296 n=1 Tax=Rosa chinensis TaxID=74649 RepID=UPI000D0882D1|nr:uncharacterized protein LOC112191296 [Rosa chinensis]
MDEDDSTALPAPPRLVGPLDPSWKLRRRNSISTSVVVATKLSHLSTSPTTPTNNMPRHSCSFPPQNGAVTPRHRPPQLDLELLSESYTSLKDLLPSSSFAAVQSPSPNSTNSGYEISIRNRLVKQAAWAYLQPMSSTSGPSGPHLLRRLWLKCTPCLSFLTHRLLPFLSRTLHRLLPCFQLS